VTDGTSRYPLVSLADLGVRARAAFAAACAERLFPLYAQYVRRTGRGDVPAARAALTALWADLAGHPTGVDFARLADRIEDLVPDVDEEEDYEYGGYAGEALSAVVYAIRAHLDQKPGYFAMAAERPIDVIDQRNTLLVEAAGQVPDDSRARPAILAERRRQAADLADLRSAGDNGLAAAVEAIRARAIREPVTPEWPENDTWKHNN
jgi:hypothetical protein